MTNTLLTKSKYMAGLQCSMYLWMQFHDKANIPEFDISTQHRMDQGTEVGNLAKTLFPNGAEISQEDFIGNIKLTKELVTQRKTLNKMIRFKNPDNIKF